VLLRASGTLYYIGFLVTVDTLNELGFKLFLIGSLAIEGLYNFPWGALGGNGSWLKAGGTLDIVALVQIRSRDALKI
jgi:hypothetical protein